MAKKPVSKTKKVASKITKKKPIAKKASVVKKVISKKTASPKSKPKAVKKPPAKKKVSYLPKGYSNVTPYLIVKNAQKAIEFYKKIFGAKETLRTDLPGGKIAHAELKIGDSRIMLADEWAEQNAANQEAHSKCSTIIHLFTKNVDDTIKLAQSAGAKVIKAVEDKYYGDRVGTLEDPFGQRWSVATHIENVSPATLKKRVAEMHGKKS